MNAALSGKKLEEGCVIAAEDRVLLEKTIKQFMFSARAYHRILKVARTIADLAASRKHRKRAPR
jgi:magnesium chelatase family protein